jgi:hypothetical protein
MYCTYDTSTGSSYSLDVTNYNLNLYMNIIGCVRIVGYSLDITNHNLYALMSVFVKSGYRGGNQDWYMDM